MAAERRAACRRPKARQVGVGAWLGLLLATSCLSPPPSRESAPSVAPPAAPAPAEAAPLEEPAPAPPAAPSVESQASEAKPSLTPPRRAQEPAQPTPRPASKARARGASGADARDDSEVGSGATAQNAARLHAQLDRAERETTPDCPAARERKKAVCDLAGQICNLTDRDPNVASVAEYCADARRRCTDAERRTAERCPD